MNCAVASGWLATGSTATQKVLRQPLLKGTEHALHRPTQPHSSFERHRNSLSEAVATTLHEVCSELQCSHRDRCSMWWLQMDTVNCVRVPAVGSDYVLEYMYLDMDKYGSRKCWLLLLSVSSSLGTRTLFAFAPRRAPQAWCPARAIFKRRHGAIQFTTKETSLPGLSNDVATPRTMMTTRPCVPWPPPAVPPAPFPEEL